MQKDFSFEACQSFIFYKHLEDNLNLKSSHS